MNKKHYTHYYDSEPYLWVIEQHPHNDPITGRTRYFFWNPERNMSVHHSKFSAWMYSDMQRNLFLQSQKKIHDFALQSHENLPDTGDLNKIFSYMHNFGRAEDLREVFLPFSLAASVQRLRQYLDKYYYKAGYCGLPNGEYLYTEVLKCEDCYSRERGLAIIG